MNQPANQPTISPAATSSAYSGVTVWTPEGKLIGRIRLPEICGNVCFGGPKRNRLFITARQSLYAVFVVACAVHVPIGLATIAREWWKLGSGASLALARVVAALLLVLGLRAVWAVYSAGM